MRVTYNFGFKLLQIYYEKNYSEGQFEGAIHVCRHGQHDIDFMY